MSNEIPCHWSELIVSLGSFDDIFLMENQNQINGLLEKEYDRLTIGIVIPAEKREAALEHLATVEMPKVVKRGVALPPLSFLRESRQSLL